MVNLKNLDYSDIIRNLSQINSSYRIIRIDFDSCRKSVEINFLNRLVDEPLSAHFTCKGKWHISDICQKKYCALDTFLHLSVIASFPHLLHIILFIY